MIVFISFLLMASKFTISVSGAFALYPLMVLWADEYKKINPNVEISVQAGGAGKGMTDLLNGMVDIAMVSREISKEEELKGAHKFAVCKDATLPIISANNPYVDSFMKRGIKKTELVEIFTDKIKFWDIILNKNVKNKINVYTRSDSCGAGETFANYLGLHQEDLEGIGIYGDPQLVQAVAKDGLGIGYANIAFIFDSKSNKPFKGIKILPLDLNEDGKISENEDFYNEKSEVLDAIRDGKLPSPPSRNLYLVLKKGEKKEYLKDFFKWILTDGQKTVEKAGFVKIEIKEELFNF